MKNDTFTNMDEQGLTAKISEMRTDLIKIRSELASKSSSQKVGQIHQLKKSIARALTVQNRIRLEQMAAQMKGRQTKEAKE